MGLDYLQLKNYDFIFISIPKTATNSIWSTFQKNHFRPFQHVKASTIKEKVDSKTWEKYKFACVRNPYDIIKSWYFYHKYHKDLDQATKNFYPDTFEEWVKCFEFKTHWEQASHLKKNPLWDGSNPLHQWRWIYDKDENLMIDYLMKYETLDIDFALIANRFNLENNLKKLNTSAYNEEDYDLDMIKKVEAFFKKDFDLLGYDKKSN